MVVHVELEVLHYKGKIERIFKCFLPQIRNVEHKGVCFKSQVE